MAGGSLGDLSFTLTLQSRIEQETKSIIQALNKVDATGQVTQKTLNLITDALSNLGTKGTSDIDKINNVLERFAISMQSLDRGVTLTNLEKAYDSLSRLRTILQSINERGMSSVTIDVGALRVEEILQQRRHAMEQNAKREEEIEAARQEQMRQSAQIAQEAYRSEIAWNEQKAKAASDAIRRQMEENAKLEAEKQEKLRQSAQIAQEAYRSEIAWNEQKAKIFSDNLRTQMENEAKLAAARKEITGTIDRFTQERAEIEKNREVLNKYESEIEKLSRYNKAVLYSKTLGGDEKLSQDIAKKEKELQDFKDKMKLYKEVYAKAEKEILELTQKISAISPGIDGKNIKGEALSGDALKEFENLFLKLKEAQSALKNADFLLPSDRVQKLHIETLTKDLENLKKIQQDIAKFDGYSHADLKKEVLQKNQELIESEKRYAREIEVTERKRQSELETSKNRIQSMEQALAGLQEKRFTAKMLGVDTTEADAKIQEMKDHLKQLREIMEGLSKGDLSHMGKLGDIGNGREVSSAKELANAYDKVNKDVQRGEELERKRQQEIAASAAKVRNELVSAFEQAKKSASGISSTLQDIKSLFLQGGIVYGAKQFFDAIVQTGGEIEKQHIALRSILGDRAKADELFNQTQQLALQSPFKFGELNKDVKQLAAFGVEANDLYETTKRLADIASGLGVDFSRLGLAYGQVKSRSWLDGKELRQFAYAGLPLLKSLTELYNQTGKGGRNDYTEGDVKKMISNREVSFEDVQKVLWGMTDEGGKFYNMQFVLSETLLGKWNKLIDAWEIMLSKFASGDSVIGSVFKTAITGATNLLLVMDKLSPALLAFGAMFAIKKGFGALSAAAGTKAMMSQMKASQMTALRTYAVEQQRELIEGKITVEKMRQNVLDQKAMLQSQITKRNQMEQLALQGRLSLMQMQRAYREKMISPELVKQLQLMGAISARQAKLITQSGLWARAQLGVIQSGIGSIFTWGNVLMVGLTAAFAIWQKIDADQEKVKQRAKDISDAARDHAQSMSDVLNENGNVDTSNPDELERANDALKDVLEQSGYYTDTIKEQVEEAQNLTEQYKILKKAVEDAKNSANTEDKYSNVISESIAASGNWFNDDLEENAKDVEKGLNRMSLAIDGFDAQTKSRMESVANNMLGPKAATMSLEDKILELQRSGGDKFDKFVRLVSNGSNDIASRIFSCGIIAKGVNSEIDEIANDDFPKIIKKIAEALHVSENDFRKWAKNNVSTFDAMFTKILSLCNIKVPSIVKKLREIMYSALNLQDPQEPKGNTPKTWKNPLSLNSVGMKAFDKLKKGGKLNGGKNGFWQKEMAELISQIGGSGGKQYHEFGEALQKVYKDVRNENNAAKKAGEKQPYLRKEQMLKAIASVMGVSLDVGKDRVTGDFGKDRGGKNKEDKELKNRQERLNSLKSARQTYQKYQKIMSDAEAKAKTYKLFPEIKDLNLDKYEESVRKIFSGFNFEKSAERRKFKTSLYRELADWAYSEEDKKLYDKKAAEYKDALNRLAERWDLYRDLLEKTGDENYANSAFRDGYVVDDKVRDLISDYNRTFGKEFGLQRIMSMTDGEAQETLKGPGEYEAWKKIVDLLRGNYIEALKNGADITKETLGYDEQIAAIQEKYNKLIKEQNELGNTRAARAYEMQRDKEIGNVNYKRVTDSMDYAKFFATSIRQSRKELQTYSDFLRNQLSAALKEGAITANEYSEKINEINKRMSDMDDGTKSFVGGGLNGLIDGLKKKGQKQQEEGNSMYDNASKAYKTAKAIGDIQGMQDAQNGMAAGQTMSAGGAELMQGADQMQSAIGMIDKIIHGINDLVQGFNDTFQDIKETAQALGQNTDTDDWSDADTFISSFSSASDSATKGWDSLKEGNIGGVISGVVGSWTAWIKGYAQGHDNKLDRQIQIAERQLKILQNISDDVSKVLENTLGGIYSYKMTGYTKDNLSKITSDYEERRRLLAQLNGTESTASSTGKGAAAGLAIGMGVGGLAGAGLGVIAGGLMGFFSSKRKKLRGKIKALPDYSDDTYEQTQKALKTGEAYDAQLASLMAQRDQIQHKRDAENSKKNKDKEKIADFDKQMEDAELEIQNFTQQWLKDIYDVDLKSWASQLTDAIVDAWSKGEDAADAYHDTVQELMKDLSKKIISQSIIEKRLQPTLDKYSELLEENSGKLSKEDLSTIWDEVIKQQQGAIDDTYSFLEYAKQHGVDLSENGSLSTSNSIKSITEETADLLASYINAIRLDVSVNRENVRLIAQCVKDLPNLNVVAQSQLSSMNTLVSLAEQRNEKLDMMYSWMRATTNGTKKINVA